MTTGFKFSTDQMPSQRRFMESTARELLYSGSFAAGKSRVGCEKGLFLSLKYPQNFGAILRKTMTSLRYTTMQTFFRDVVPPSMVDGWNQLTSILRLKNGSQIVFMGLDDPQKIGSLELGWAFVDEGIEITEDDYMMLLGRLRLPHVPFQQLMIATNPGSPSHHLYSRFFLNPSTNGHNSAASSHHSAGGREAISSNTLDNPFLPAEYRRSLEQFRGNYYRRYVEGKWIGFEGLVYDNFDPQRHVIEEFPVPADWRLFRAVDFGYSNPFVCQWWVQHPAPPESGCLCPAPVHATSVYYLVAEIYRSGRTVEEHARRIREVDRQFPQEVEATFSDWQAADRASLEKYGVPTVPAAKQVEPGIQAVYGAIDGNRILLFRNALLERDDELRKRRLPAATVEEFGSYRWMEASTGKNPKERPRDADNHGMDAMRYLVFSLEGNSPPQPVVVGKRREAGSDLLQAATATAEVRSPWSGERHWAADGARKWGRWR